MRCFHAGVVAGVFATGVLSCSADDSSAPRPRGAIVVHDGDEQDGLEGELLEKAIVVSVVDERGMPLPGVGVLWSAEDGGVAHPAESVTDAAGRALTRWTLGAEQGEHALVVRADGYGTLTLRANGVAQTLPIDSIRSLDLSTYDGSGETVHPDFLAWGSGTAARELLAVTPYPNGDPSKENPVVYLAKSGRRWAVPVPSLNPIVTPLSGYLSDPDLVEDPIAGEVRLYYRHVDQSNEILMLRTKDVSVWSEPMTVVRAPNHEVVSPSIVRRSASEWLMWSVNGGAGCAGTESKVELRRSMDGISWSDPEPVNLSQGGFTPWHIDVQWIPARSEYWAVYNVKPLESCSTPAVYFATSADGVHWKTYASPLLARGAVDQFRDIVYRSTFAYDAVTGIATFWYSGARHDGHAFVWSAAAQRRRIADVFAQIERPDDHGGMNLRRPVPALMDPP